MSSTKKLWETAASAVMVSSMTEHDLLEVVEIEEQSGLSRWGWSAYYAELQSSNRELMFVGRVTRPLEQSQTHNLAGYIVARLAADELHINNVAVRQDYRKQGLGSALLLRVLHEGRRLGGVKALLEVRSGNVVAQGLYQRGGFQLIGRRRNYYTDPPEDALVMSAILSDVA
jgi:ribosomal-protein-alanine N-acetyltransferase